MQSWRNASVAKIPPSANTKKRWRQICLRRCVRRFRVNIAKQNRRTIAFVIGATQERRARFTYVGSTGGVRNRTFRLLFVPIMICGPSGLIQLRVWLLVTSAMLVVSCLGAAQQVSAPATGKLYHGFYYDGPAADGQDPTEHNVAPEDVTQYERAVGKKTAWVFFS